MPYFDRGKIYKIECRITGLKYIGSTTNQHLCNRLAQHTNRFRSPHKNQYATAEIIKNGVFFIELLESYPCETKEQLILKEREWYDKMECINKQVPARTKDEYNNLHRDAHNEYSRNYYKANKERLIVQCSERRRQRKKELIDSAKI
jgi:tetrahydrodipicolinate N-succinyltransferase